MKVSNEHVTSNSNLVTKTVVNKTSNGLKRIPVMKTDYFFCAEKYPKIS